MPRRELPYVGGLSRDPTLHESAQDTINYLPVPAPRPGARSAVILRQAPGLRPWVDAHVSGIAGVGPTRKLHNVEGRLLWVTGNALVEVTPAGVMVPRGTIPGVERVSMAHNQQGLGHEVLTVNGQAGYVLDTGTLAFGRVTDEAFTGALQVAYADQYLVGVESQGRHWMHSDLSDAYSWNSFDRYEAEADPDRIVGIAVNHREVLVFGKETIEPFVNNPTDPAGIAPYVRADNTVIEAGCARDTPRRG